MENFKIKTEELVGNAVVKDNHLKYQVDEGFYLKINNKSVLGNTIISIMKKLKMRYCGENKEDLSKDILSVAIEKVTEVLFYT